MKLEQQGLFRGRFCQCSCDICIVNKKECKQMGDTYLIITIRGILNRNTFIIHKDSTTLDCVIAEDLRGASPYQELHWVFRIIPRWHYHCYNRECDRRCYISTCKWFSGWWIFTQILRYLAIWDHQEWMKCERDAAYFRPTIHNKHYCQRKK